MVYDCSEKPILEKFVRKQGNDEKAEVFNFKDAQIFNKLLKERKE